MKKTFKRIIGIALCAATLVSSSVFAVPTYAATTNTYDLGDVNFDRYVNVDDIIKLQDYVISPPSSVTNKLLAVADIDKNGKINNDDVSAFVDGFIAADSHRGDVNEDGELDIKDATDVQMYLAKYDVKGGFFKKIENILAADMNQDNCISIMDTTDIQKIVSKYDTPKTDFPTASVKATDKECRAKYADYIKQYNLSDMLKGYYVVGQNSSSWLIFRDDKWEYFYNYYDNTVGLCDYLGNNKTEILPVKLTTGKSVIKVGSYSDFSPVYTGTYNDKKAPYSTLENIFIPSNYKLMRNSFEGNKKIKNVFFASDNGVAHETSVFEDCSSLERVVLPSSMSTVPFGMFDGCKSIKKIVLPEGLTTVDKYAFRGTSISKLVVPKSVKVIKDEAFASPKLRDVYVMSKTTDLDITWLAAEGLQWSSLSLHGYKNSTLHDYWKLSEEEDLNVKMVFLN